MPSKYLLLNDEAWLREQYLNKGLIQMMTEIIRIRLPGKKKKGKKMSRKIDWAKLTLIEEPMSEDDGGGYRCYFKELGFAAYGVGKTPKEALKDLEVSKSVYQTFIGNTPEYQFHQNLFTDS